MWPVFNSQMCVNLARFSVFLGNSLSWPGYTFGTESARTQTRYSSTTRSSFTSSCSSSFTSPSLNASPPPDSHPPSRTSSRRLNLICGHARQQSGGRRREWSRDVPEHRPPEEPRSVLQLNLIKELKKIQEILFFISLKLKIQVRNREYLLR